MIYNIRDTEQQDYINRVRLLWGDTPRYVFVSTFGCQQNQRDSERIIGLCRECGYSLTDDYTVADLVIINTCAIREHAEDKALSMLGKFKALKAKNPELIVGVVGCMAAEAHRAEGLKRDFHYVSFTLEPNMLHRIPEMIYTKASSGKRTFIYGEDKGDIYEEIPSVRLSGHSAWVSIMYGCNNFCSYCIVPYVRGRERSRASADVIEECRELVSKGIKEITLLGQNVNSYRSDMNFSELISRIAEIDGDFIIRFMTSHPKDTSDELILAMKKYSPKIASFFHLPLQSGSDRILKRMNRTYTKDAYLEIARKLRESIPNIALSTDVIIGFPGEEAVDFDETVDVLNKVGFDNVYPFFYSPREGTLAAKMENKISKEERASRMDRLIALQEKISYSLNLPYENTRVRVLVDKAEIRDGERICTSRTDTNKIVYFTSDKASVGEFADVLIERARPFDLLAKEI